MFPCLGHLCVSIHIRQHAQTETFTVRWCAEAVDDDVRLTGVERVAYTLVQFIVGHLAPVRLFDVVHGKCVWVAAYCCYRNLHLPYGDPTWLLNGELMLVSAAAEINE